MIPAGWLCVDGVELVNHARTLTYLRNGLAGPNWDVMVNNTGSVSGYVELPYEDEYVDDYYELVTHDCADSFIPLCLECACAAMVAIDETFVDPASDEAPWYVASRPQSADFLGVLLDDIDDRPPNTRTMTRWASGGAGVTPFTPTERTAGFTATLIAATPAGMEWGRRWVSDILSGGLCGGDASEVTFLPSCPDDDDPAYRRYARVGLIDPPAFTALDDDVPECEAMQVRWQIGAGVPWLLAVPEQIDVTATLHAGESASFALDANEWNGDLAALLRVEAGTAAADDISVTAYPVPEGGTCPIPGSPNPCHAFTIPTIGAYGVVEIDSAEEEATYYNPTTKQPEPAWPLLDFSGPWSWLTVPPCSTVCLVVTNNGSGVVDISAFGVAREA